MPRHSVPSSGTEFIDSLLKPKISERVTAEEALESSFFKEMVREQFSHESSSRCLGLWTVSRVLCGPFVHGWIGAITVRTRIESTSHDINIQHEW